MLSTTASPMAVISCPTDLSGWREWHRQTTDAFFASNLSDERLVEIGTTLRRCNPQLEAIPAAQKCMSNFSRFFEAVTREKLMSGHQLGASMTDAQYFAEMPYPLMLELPEELTNCRPKDGRGNRRDTENAAREVEGFLAETRRRKD